MNKLIFATAAAAFAATIAAPVQASPEFQTGTTVPWYSCQSEDGSAREGLSVQSEEDCVQIATVQVVGVVHIDVSKPLLCTMLTGTSCGIPMVKPTLTDRVLYDPSPIAGSL